MNIWPPRAWLPCRSSTCSMAGASSGATLGAFLQVASQDRDGTWLAVALMEDDDDQNTVTSARYLNENEIKAVARMRRGQQ